jgi:glycosyltransferase involved in cell wall biosynthesis
VGSACIWESALAFERLRNQYGERVRLCIASEALGVGDGARAHELFKNATFGAAMDEADVYVASGDDPNLLEAMARGMPIVATPTCDLATSLLRPGKDGFIVESSALQLEDGMRRFLDDTWMVERMGRNARERVKLADVSAIAERLNEILGPELGKKS